MKKIKVIAAILVCWQTTFGQGNFTTAPVYQFPTLKTPDLQSGSFFLDYLRDEKSADLVRPDLYAGVEGTPFLSEEWMHAQIKLADNRVFDSVLLKVNLFENKVYFKDDKNRERQVAIQVKEIHVEDPSSKLNNQVFVSGYGEEPDVFYQVITDGKKAALLKSLKTIIKESKVFNAPNKKEFEVQGYSYIISNSTVYGQSKNCSSLMTAFGNDNKVTNFVSANDIKCNKEKDLLKLVNYYNSY